MTATKKTTTKTRKPRTVTVKKPVSLDLPRNPFVFEVLDLVSKQRTKAKKIEVLKKYEDPSLKAILIWNFDESLVSILPEGEVPYSGYDEQNSYSGGVSAKISQEVRSMHEQGNFSLGVSDGQGHTTIRREFKNFYRFIRGGDDRLNNLRRESMFINILQGLHPLEAEIIVLCKDKKLGELYKITQEIVAQAYPDIQWGNRV
tara:strand:+ start:906 stop:1511 length:606 start_codon:yes stop_codon:yes gene_type:complete